jgi:superoxide dismutase, Cu-Zn family
MIPGTIGADLASLLACQSLAASDDLRAPIVNNADAVIGDVGLEKASGGVLLNLRAKGLPPGDRGMHFHAVGDRSDHVAFEAGGPHTYPHKKPHGFLHPQGPHAGNLPNLIVRADGTAEVELYMQLVRLDEGPTALLDADGSSLIIHAEPDDNMTQPIGGSGARIACAVVKHELRGRGTR